MLLKCQLKALGIDNILGFDWPASPPPEAMIRALEVLYSLGVLDDDAKLTSPTGFQVAEIPLVGCQLMLLRQLKLFEKTSICTLRLGAFLFVYYNCSSFFFLFFDLMHLVSIYFSKPT